MKYCFVKQDLEKLDKKDPLYIQSVFARKVDSFLELDLNQKSFNGKIPFSEEVFLRCTCDSFEIAEQILRSKGIALIEDAKQKAIIERWYKTGIAKREIYELPISEYINGLYNKNIISFLQENSLIFVKSLLKGFSIETTAQRFLHDSELKELIINKSEGNNTTLLISKCLNLKNDSLGKKETRHFIINGNVENSSRMIHSLMHNCLNSHVRKAKEIVQIINRLDFPKSYVLDLGEFEDDGLRFVDVVEINPISLSMCYLNNSIFIQSFDNEVNYIHSQSGMGIEYCYDYSINPERYRSEKFVGDRFEYQDETHYVFK